MMSSAEPVPAELRPTTVFLSYARADQAQATKLANALQAAGFKVWWDELIEGGAEFAKAIETALIDCDAVIVVWSKSSITSDWVRDEAAKGRDLHKLVPLSLDRVEPPLGFGQYHAIDFSRWRGDAGAPEMANLTRAIAALARAPRAEHSRNIDMRPPLLTRRRMVIAAAASVAAGAAAYFAWREELLGNRGEALGNSIAVLPFQNLSGDASQAYFSDGLAEEVRSTLARDARLLVMAPTSSGQFRDRKDGAITIASKLGVACLLEGSVRRANDIVRVAAELIDGKTGFSRWSQVFDRRMNDIFAVQSEIATTVARALAMQVAVKSEPANANETPTSTLGGTNSVVAYDAYLHGRALYDLSADETSERAALAQFDIAIAADPNYAAAHAARARSLTVIANQYADPGQLSALYDAAIEGAQRAIAIAPDLADAHSTLGYVLFQGRLDARAAREPFDRSSQLGGGDAAVMARFAQYCSRVGRDREAAQAIKRALALDPLNPLIFRAAGLIEFAARRYAASIAPLRQALAMNPKMSRAHAAIGDALLMLGRVAEARDEYAAEPTADFKLCGKAIAEQKLGRKREAQAAFTELVATLGERVLYQQAQVLAQWGDSNAAILKLQRARAIGDSGLIYARNDPLLDSLRKHPGFLELLDSIGFD